MDHLIIETPEQIPLDFLLAGIGSRFLALAVDTIIQTVAVVAVGLLALLVAGGVAAARTGGATWVMAALFLAFFLVQFGYFAFFEAIWNGQTPGKRYLHLRVIKDDGRPISTFDALGRNLLRIVDSIPGIYAVAIVTALISSKNKRLGDYVTGTVVVHERPLAGRGEMSWGDRPKPEAARTVVRARSVLNLNADPPPAPPPEPVAPAETGYDTARLSGEELRLMETFLLRRGHLAVDVRVQMARKIVDRIAPKLEISQADQRDAENLIQRLATEYRSHRFR